MSRLKHSGLVMALWLLAGCSAGGGEVKGKKTGVTPAVTTTAPGKVSAPARPPTPAPAAVPAGQSSAMENCSRELNALKRLDSRQYSRRKTQFDRLMAGASVYTGVRGDVAGGTREAVDAMYRFRTGKLCAEISQDVLEALSRQGEGGPSGNRQ
ncbi:hypothetical protein D8R48_22855 [Salmonella enterica subsp. enterica serovar Newport]|uniref:Lipoprotein n=1 Tax=Salmonella enterica subsp. salamae TaxID=59202 RepID=A0A5Y3MX55_SALER|nr:hypothetical protein [Salmonella enterica subsp. enterica serovar Newport]EAB9314443.1 hypothetical protein [Salmonella enterica subsp. enterica serovar Typhimurium]EAP1716816.1 hypothetical protein [Salmonella enterica]ECI4012539.1 hypothetical protein [Salmonella enterica subsp. salamae]EAB8441495.1 hypothetical protein [Salmonella enterica subsp. enterica serovar Newport]